MTIAESLRRFRKNYKLRQVDVANALGVKTQSYASYESKTRVSIPGANIIIRIADAYNVTTDYLLGRSDNPKFANRHNSVDFDTYVSNITIDK